VFVQNLGSAERFLPGDPVRLCWEPGYTFGLAGDADAGIDRDLVGVPA
jgi:hypothetical protein